MTTFAETLQRCMWGKVGSQKLSNLTKIPKSKIDSWLQGRVQRPRDWRPILTIAQALLLTRDEADTVLLAAGHRTIGELAERLALEHPDRRYLQPWLAAPQLPLSSRHQLRAAVGDFVGRTAEIAQLEAALHSAAGSGAAISGVQGMGGIGKTELAYVVAGKLRSAFPDAQLVLALRGSSPTPLPPEQALQTIIRAFSPDAKLPEDLPTLETLYRAQLHEKRVLILADGARDAVHVRSLLPPAGCALLVTSRTRFTLPGMATVDLEQLSEAEAVTLLRDICQRISEADAQALARACGYLPLALRVSGSILHNTPALPVAAYLQRLADERQHLALLRDPDDEQLDVAASLSLSYAQLDAAAQQVFRQIGVFVADFDLPLALAVVEEDTGVDVQAMLNMLLRRNLVMYDMARSRWRLHDLVRDLARHYLEATGELEATVWRYARAVMQLTQAIQEQYLAGGDDVLAALARFDLERPHIDAARRWALSHAGTPAGDTLLRDDALASSYFEELRHDNQQERIVQLKSALAAAQRLGDRYGEGIALHNLGVAYRMLGNVQQAIVYYEQWLALTRTIGDQHGEGQALTGLSLVCDILGDPVQAIAYGEQRLALARAIDDRRGEGEALRDLGLAYMSLGEIRRAIACNEQAISIARGIGDQRLEGIALNNLGVTYRMLGDAAQALAACQVASAIARELRDRRLESTTSCNLGNAYLDLGEIRQAIACYEQALSIARTTGDRRIEGQILTMLGCGYLEDEDLVRARDSSMAARTITREVGDQDTEGLALMCLGRVCAAGGALAEARSAFEEARTIFQAIGDRRDESECNWHSGLFFAQQGEREQALPLLRATLAYEQEIGHTEAAEHAALLARLEAGEGLPAERHTPPGQRAVGEDWNAPTDDDQP